MFRIDDWPQKHAGTSWGHGRECETNGGRECQESCSDATDAGVVEETQTKTSPQARSAQEIRPEAADTEEEATPSPPPSGKTAWTGWKVSLMYARFETGRARGCVLLYCDEQWVHQDACCCTVMDNGLVQMPSTCIYVFSTQNLIVCVARAKLSSHVTVSLQYGVHSCQEVSPHPSPRGRKRTHTESIHLRVPRLGTTT